MAASHSCSSCTALLSSTGVDPKGTSNNKHPVLVLGSAFWESQPETSSIHLSLPLLLPLLSSSPPLSPFLLLPLSVCLSPYLFLIFMIWVLCLNVCIPLMYAMPVEVRRGLLGTGATGVCEPPCRCWNSNMGSLKEQLLLLITERSLHKHIPFKTGFHILQTHFEVVAYSNPKFLF